MPPVTIMHRRHPLRVPPDSRSECMRARAAAKTGLSLTVEPRTARRESPRQAEHKRAKQVAWGALLVSAAAIGGYLLGPVLSGSSPPQPAAQVIEGDGVRAPKSMVWIPGGEFMMGSEHQLARPNEKPAHRVRVHGFWM